MSEVPDPLALEAFRRALEGAWQERSRAERFAFGSVAGVTAEPFTAPAPDQSALQSAGWRVGAEVRVGPSATYPRPEVPRSAAAARPAVMRESWNELQIAGAVAQLETLAALSGAVEPKHLVATAENGLADILLERMANSFDRGLADDQWLWTLKAGPREAVLRDLDGEALRLWLDRVEALPTDAAGDLLRLLARGHRLAGEDAALPDRTHLQSLVQALAWGGDIIPNAKPRLEAVRRQLAIQATLAACDHLLANGFVGRAAEVERLRGFARHLEPRGPIPILTVSGVGGSGKSTLLAYSLRPMIERAFKDRQAPMVVTLDFDRRSFRQGGEIELSLELSRQLGLIEPRLAPRFTELREQIQRDRVQRGEFTKEFNTSFLESGSRHSSEFEFRARDAIQEVGLFARPLVVVLDTFEEWQKATRSRHDIDGAERRVLEWLDGLRDAWEVSLGVIVSGRTPIPPRSYLRAPNPIHLGPLTRTESTALLRQLGVSPGAARDLARLAGRNPLALKVAGRFYLKLPHDRRAEFLAGAPADLAGLSAALRQGLLYRRFLDHVDDPRARQLAHPGLALRYVTPDLIQHVLAEPCGLGELRPHEADELFDVLEREVWLVERRGEELVHRPEVRRAMLKSMAEDPQQAPRIAAVHRAAVDWFSSERGADQRADELYHKLWLMQADEFQPWMGSIEPTALRALASDVDDFPDAIRVQLLDRLGRRLTEADAALLPDLQRRAWADRRALDLVNSGEPDRALALWRAFAGASATPGPWFLGASFLTGDWSIDATLHEFEEHDPAIQLKYAYLMAAALQDSDPGGSEQMLRRIDPIVTNQLSQMSERRIGQSSEAIVLENLYFQRATEIPAHDVRELWRGTLDWGSVLKLRSLGATEFLRLRALPAAWRIEVDPRRIIAGAFQPTAPWLKGVIARMEVDPGPLRRYVAMVERSGGVSSRDLPLFLRGRKAANVLGEWADRFADAMMECFADPPDDRELYRLLGPRSDDPEWRVPLRAALTEAIGRQEFSDFARDLQKRLGSWTPNDLYADHLEDVHGRSPRTAWLKAIEYADRCRLLPVLMARYRDHDHLGLRRTVRAYLHWDANCKAIADGHE